MKTAGEVLGELLVGCVRALTPEEREKMLLKGKLHGKYIEFVLPSEHEACVIHFGETEGSWIFYDTFSTPEVMCKECKWEGKWEDLNIKEELMDLTGVIGKLDLFKPIKRTVIEECVECGSSKLKYKDWKFEDADLIIKGEFGDIGSVAELLIGGFFHKLKKLFGVLGSMIRKRVSIMPLRRLGTAIKVTKLITGKVSEDYKED